MSDGDRGTTERARQLETLDRLAQRFGQTLSSAFDRNLNAGRQLDGVLASLASKLSNVAVKAALAPVKTGVTSLVNGLLSAASGAGTTALASGGLVADGRIVPFRLGGVLGGGRVRPFAAGGVVAAPTYFPLAGPEGGTGLMGEAGPEAILPLRRGSDGRLGVAAGGAERPVSVTVNIATPDIEGFRRSEA
ncbi:MAG TPA: phage tail tape measure protein [Methylobacterium sp.]|jgi:lambda family phage tail tape measure protein|uniref:phage tail tape measure protein n=1 Tax=Methylorubrum sp. B1-46 TaxID=2897334 RepID=UPI001E5BBB24|nr:phage tail tape measure protein [Methylorubrum sp. B1-46]UGB27420.1 phage tail tape measure protein [Methylorubrum sp. B1-46]HEV2544090.1 phage tail tape measure protein [Methylobacterium sp.]